MLGAMYFQGKDLPKNYVLAHMWFNLAASQATGDDRQISVKLRDAIEKEMTREQVAEAKRLAREWKPKGSGSQ